MSEFNLSDLDTSSKGLFSLLDSQFVDFDPIQNMSSMSVPFPRNHSARKNWDIHPSASWGITYQYIPRLDSYGCTELSIPKPNGQCSIFRRPLTQPRIFLPITSDRGIEELQENPNRSTPAFSPSLIAEILGGAAFPFDFSSTEKPVLINRRLAAIKAKATSWQSEDKKTVPVRPAVSIDITRRFVQGAGSNNSSVRLMAIKSTLNSDGTRNQLVIEFRGRNYWVNPPTIFGCVLGPESLSFEDNPKTIEIYKPQRTAKLIDAMATFLVDELL